MFDIPEKATEAALAQANAAQASFYESLQQRGAEVLRRYAKRDAMPWY